ncbi:protein-lysine N-methyltransferase EEF2KMT isoform X4 [Antennarius striatus]|uniref:protein-lysine N-methyltransferase EEF2KMT isoform X4 n=1 Tax=Antennarius striatus TaxID=241820 RepID=UPI0035B0FBC2
MEPPEPDRTPDSAGTSKADFLRDFQACFFVMRRLASFPWKTCLHPVCRTFPPSVRFRRLFLSELIRREAAGCEPLDELYDALAEVVGAEDAVEFYKSYFLPGGDAVSLLENASLISEGTTGLVTWEAALYLAEWALDHQQVFAGRTVLELGSGVGLAGVAICRSCSPSRYVFSDCHPRVLQKLRTNVQLNGLTSPVVGVEELDWTDATEGELTRIGAETVIASDVVYDPVVADILVALLGRILRSSSPDVFICSTVRNQETYSSFKQRLGKEGIEHQVLTGGVTDVFPYNRDSSIELIKLYKQSK